MGPGIVHELEVPRGAGRSDHEQGVAAFGICAALPQDSQPPAVDPEATSRLEIATSNSLLDALKSRSPDGADVITQMGSISDEATHPPDLAQSATEAAGGSLDDNEKVTADHLADAG